MLGGDAKMQSFVDRNEALRRPPRGKTHVPNLLVLRCYYEYSNTEFKLRLPNHQVGSGSGVRVPVITGL